MAHQNKTKPTDKQLIIDPFLDAFNGDIPKLYSNGLSCQLSLVDGTILFQQHNNNICAVTMPLALFKSLRDNIDKLLEIHNKDIKSNIRSVEEIVANSNVQNGGV
jgi:hypothetical protein